MESSDISSFGLVLDIVGALLIWKFGLPEEVYRSGRVPAIYNPATPDEEKKIRKYDRLATIGVLALVCGFALQLVGTLWSRFSPRPVAPQISTVPDRAKFKTGDYLMLKESNSVSSIVKIVAVEDEGYKVFTHFLADGRLIVAQDYQLLSRAKADREYVLVEAPKADGSFSPDKFQSKP
ncbi:MAG: hypothetical protein Q7S40_29355 [Opitutaceae bacterium]|nr:hypothetical protein [Opitutaceae bacterium]